MGKNNFIVKIRLEHIKNDFVIYDFYLFLLFFIIDFDLSQLRVVY